MRFSFASAARGSCAASSESTLAIVAEDLRSGTAAEAVLSAVQGYQQTNPEVTGGVCPSWPSEPLEFT